MNQRLLSILQNGPRTQYRFARLGALGYFISVLDVIPDFAPIVDYSDDLGVLA